MTSWIVGGLIIGVTVYIIVKTTVCLRRGESSCGCSKCSEGDCCSKGRG
ncbi:MAG TPA: FeoB-associated Cys-rich membrane protein [Clostridia bacterium]|nr:FeoB-associated Cys-rich membrane protein [Clostridia bacterium]